MINDRLYNKIGTVAEAGKKENTKIGFTAWHVE